MCMIYICVWHICTCVYAYVSMYMYLHRVHEDVRNLPLSIFALFPLDRVSQCTWSQAGSQQALVVTLSLPHTAWALLILTTCACLFYTGTNSNLTLKITVRLWDSSDLKHYFTWWHTDLFISSWTVIYV